MGFNLDAALASGSTSGAQLQARHSVQAGAEPRGRRGGLQQEAVAQHREHTQMILELEEKVEYLTKENWNLRNAIASAAPANPQTPQKKMGK